MKGVPPSPFAIGIKIPAELASGAWTTITIVSMRADGAEISLDDGSVWRMSRHRPGEPLSAFAGQPVFHTQDWYVRGRVPE